MDRLLSIAKKFRPPIQLVGDIGISAALVATLSTVGWACVGGLDKHGGAFWLMVPGMLGFIELLLAAPLIAVPAYGVAKGRLGFVIGPIFLVMIVYGFSALILKQKEDAFAELTPFAAGAVQDHTLLALDDNDHGSSCDEACIKVLATSNHTLAMRVDWNIWRRDKTGTPRGWFLYTQIDGTACFAQENAKLALNFLLNGFPDKCATKKTIPDFDDGLLLRTVRVEAKGHPLPYLPEGFSGSAYEYFERIEGQDRLLARHIKGGLAPTTQSLLMFEKRPPAIDAGPAIDRMSFLASEIGSDVAGLRHVVDPFPFDAVLAGIERFFDQRETIGADALKYAKWAWVQIASNASRKEPQIVRERILQLLTSHDLLRIAVGIDAIFVMPFDDRRNLPDDVMLDLIVAPLNDDATSSLEQHLDRHFAPGRAPPSEEIRERAKAYLSDPSLSSWKLSLLQRLSEPK